MKESEHPYWSADYSNPVRNHERNLVEKTTLDNAKKAAEKHAKKAGAWKPNWEHNKKAGEHKAYREDQPLSYYTVYKDK